MARENWCDREQAFPRPAVELGRIARRCRHRIGAAILAAIVLAGAAVAVLVLRSGQHEAQVILRVSEGIIGDGQGMPRGQVRGYVESALLTRPVLLEIVEREDLFAAQREHSDQHAIEALRRSLELEVFGNFFATWERVGPRSLRIRITYRSSDREEAASVARAIAQMVESAEIEQRRWRFDESSKLSQSVITRVERSVDARERELKNRLVELRKAELQGDRIHAGSLRLRAQHLADTMRLEQRGLRNAHLAQSNIEFRRSAARERLGILFRVVGETIPPPVAPYPWSTLVMLGGVVFVVALPLTGTAAGAFDRRLHDLDDVARLGVASLGHVPRFRDRRPPSTSSS